MESAMLYNLPLLLAMFAVIGSLRLAYPGGSQTTSLAILLVAIVCGMLFCETSKAATLILCLVANAVNACLVWILPVGRLDPNRTRLVGSFLGLFVLVQILAFGYSRIVLGGWTPQPIDCVMYVFCVGLVYWSLFWLLGLGKASGSSTAEYVALVVLILPVTVAGPIALMAWEECTRKESWMSLLSTFVPVCMVCLSKAVQVRDDCRWTKVRSACIVCSVLLLSPWLLSRGNGFQLARLLSMVSWVEIGFSPVLSDYNSEA
jgi:hypothetical protein